MPSSSSVQPWGITDIFGNESWLPREYSSTSNFDQCTGLAPRVAEIVPEQSQLEIIATLIIFHERANSIFILPQIPQLLARHAECMISCQMADWTDRYLQSTWNDSCVRNACCLLSELLVLICSQPMFMFPQDPTSWCYLTGTPRGRQLMKVNVARVVEFIWDLRINDAVPPKNVDLLGVLTSCNRWRETLAGSCCPSNDLHICIRFEIQKCFPQDRFQSLLRYHLMPC